MKKAEVSFFGKPDTKNADTTIPTTDTDSLVLGQVTAEQRKKAEQEKYLKESHEQLDRHVRLGILGDEGDEVAVKRLRFLLESRKRPVAVAAFEDEKKRAEEAERNRNIRRVALDVQERILERKYPHTITKLDAIRLCLRCKEYYRRGYSLGRWQCLYHPGTQNGREDEWTCCGRSLLIQKKGLDGCTLCDHSDRFDDREGIPAYYIDDPELNALISPNEEAVIMSEIEIGGKFPPRWAVGPLSPLASKLDRNPNTNNNSGQTPFLEDMREQDALAVTRSKPVLSGVHIVSQFSLADPECDPTARRGEVMSEMEERYSKSASRVLLQEDTNLSLKRQRTTTNNNNNSNNSRFQSRRNIRKAYYVQTAAFGPSFELLEKLGK